MAAWCGDDAADDHGLKVEDAADLKMDPIGWFIATTHQILGHDKCAQVLGVDPHDGEVCKLCEYEKNPSDEGKREIIRSIGMPEPQ
jgi:hypothetical protein